MDASSAARAGSAICARDSVDRSVYAVERRSRATGARDEEGQGGIHASAARAELDRRAPRSGVDHLVDRRRLVLYLRRCAHPGEGLADRAARRSSALCLDRVLTTTTYTFTGSMRGQVRLYVPWPRIQAALTDDTHSMPAYRYDRGEPRTSIEGRRDSRPRDAAGQHCVDCSRCVTVCPTGSSTSATAPRLACVQCGAFIDAYDTVINKVGRPIGLIAYDNDIDDE